MLEKTLKFGKKVLTLSWVAFSGTLIKRHITKVSWKHFFTFIHHQTWCKGSCDQFTSSENDCKKLKRKISHHFGCKQHPKCRIHAERKMKGFKKLRSPGTRFYVYCGSWAWHNSVETPASHNFTFYIFLFIYFFWNIAFILSRPKGNAATVIKVNICTGYFLPSHLAGA